MTSEEAKAHHAANKCRKWLAKWLLFVKEKCPESVIREVRMAIQALVDHKLDAEHFIKKIKPIFNSSPSPRLAPFLKVSSSLSRSH
jgi:NHR1 homology to TAF